MLTAGGEESRRNLSDNVYDGVGLQDDLLYKIT